MKTKARKIKRRLTLRGGKEKVERTRFDKDRDELYLVRMRSSTRAFEKTKTAGPFGRFATIINYEVHSTSGHTNTLLYITTTRREVWVKFFFLFWVPKLFLCVCVCGWVVICYGQQEMAVDTHKPPLEKTNCRRPFNQRRWRKKKKKKPLYNICVYHHMGSCAINSA